MTEHTDIDTGTTYRAAVVTTPGNEDTITFLDLPRPALGSGHIRIAVRAAAVNPVDLAVRSGVFHGIGAITQPDHVGLGWDVAGTVLEIGDGVEREDLATGTLVAGLVPGLDRDFGPYATELVLPASDVAVVPDGLSAEAAATVPLNALTATQMLDLIGVPAPGDDRLLVTGAAGAVGGYLLTLAQERGWQVSGLARTTDAAFVGDHGAELVTEPVPGWDAVLDAAAMQQEAVHLVRDGGRYVGVQPAFPVEAERDVRVAAVAVEPDCGRLADLLARVAAGELSTRIADVLPLNDAADAHRLVAKGGLRGRVVLVP